MVISCVLFLICDFLSLEAVIHGGRFDKTAPKLHTTQEITTKQATQVFGKHISFSFINFYTFKTISGISITISFVSHGGFMNVSMYVNLLGIELHMLVAWATCDQTKYEHAAMHAAALSNEMSAALHLRFTTTGK